MDQLTDQIRVQESVATDFDVIMKDGAVISPVPSAQNLPSYTPQFSSQASIVLNRLKSSSNELKNQDSEGFAATDLKDTLSIATPTRYSQLVSADSLNESIKRKRDDSSEKVDFSQDTIHFPWKGTSPSHQASLETRRLGEEIRCSKCDETAQIHPLVTCSRCLTSWHQQCHLPLINNEAMTSANFTCAACAAGREQILRHRGKVSQQRQHEIDRLRQRRLSTLPRGIVPAKPNLVGFGAGRASDSARADYFDSMSKTDLLNILSLSDQLKPNLLVDVLVSVSRRHPDLPIFDSPDWDGQLLNTSRPAKVSKHDERPRHGHVLPNRAMKHRQKTTKKILKRTRVIEVITSAPDDDVHILPPTWAKAGEGMYSKLPLETEDRLFLMDENDEESFSHFFVDRAGRQIMEPVGA
ncbi:hypothetical protein FHETE_3995 [Fusarium heterosporum]|uniref:Zinc finger PHD-type domain-containing protein n=1 Tax=Fusarium heterosporum TaxID=42747 RepID=A0A8H5TNS7_FUSHE|nr:hypothetical protein FHETE_3995 [Fusarium heterosporum]